MPEYDFDLIPITPRPVGCLEEEGFPYRTRQLFTWPGGFTISYTTTEQDGGVVQPTKGTT